VVCEIQASAMDASRGIMSGTMNQFKRVRAIFFMFGHFHVLFNNHNYFALQHSLHSIYQLREVNWLDPVELFV
jgi:hypothetical protein